MVLNLLNGLAMLEHFKGNKNCNNSALYIPFNEAMCVGEANEEIFSPSFNHLRAQALQVSFSEYQRITLIPLKPFLNIDAEKIILWFDYDMFCQINLLTVLAYLDQQKYTNSLLLNLTNHSIVESKSINPKGYKRIYDNVLLRKINPDKITLPSLNKGIQLYLHLQQNDNEIYTFIKNNSHLSTELILKKLLENFKHYGLGDTQYLQLIHKYL